MLTLYPKRIVCLTEETTETLYLLGAQELIVGISGFTVRPKIARKEKKIVSTYLDAKFDEIISLKPDIVLTWSDLQADISAELIRRGIQVLCFNHRSVDGIKQMIFQLGSLTGKQREAEKLLIELEENISRAESFKSNVVNKPKIYFEEWYDPLISGICWVSEIIEICGGVDIFSENSVYHDAKRRIIADSDLVVERNPDIILASWCGKMFKPERMTQRNNWVNINAFKNGQVFEIHSSVILQPGPAALSEGLSTILTIIENWVINNNTKVLFHGNDNNSRNS